MALHRLLGITIGAPAPDELDAFFSEIGLLGGSGHWGSVDLPDQIQIVEAPYRKLVSMRVACEDEADLAATAARLEALGVASQTRDGALSCTDPTGHWQVVIEPTAKAALSPQPHRPRNRPGERVRQNARADVVTEATPRPPRRLGHVVLGSPDPIGTSKFFLEGIGFRLSDQILGVLSFMRCSTDHHNLLVMPGPVSYLNHYALEHDDTDAVGAAAGRYLDGKEDRHVVGLGRHVVGSNVFWYMNDPAGTMFEFFSDMDDIPDDDAWEVGTDWGVDQFSSWGPKVPPPEFGLPADIDAIGAAQEAERR